MERRLTAILAADVVGFGRLMGLDEAGTLAQLKELRSEFIDRGIAAHQGRIVKLTGDGILAEFPSVVRAVACAAEMQRGMHGRCATLPPERRIEFRIGVNLGDVISEEGDIYGDGVNLAVRLEGIAAPGGICVSQSVRDHVGNRLPLAFQDRGEQQLKNVETPIRVYDVLLEEATMAGAISMKSDRPSIVVLPFNNMSGDPEQEYFSDGITEDIITDLSKISGLRVVARHTAFTYKNKPVRVQQLGQELGVGHVLEGSVRKAGGRVRITGQLISSRDGGHLWADRFDRDLTDIFAIQDEITHAIVEQLKVKLLPQEKKSIEQAPTDNVEAYTYYLKGRQLLHRGSTSYYKEAREMFAHAVQLDPSFARAYAGIADCDSFLFLRTPEAISPESILAMSEKALALDDDLAEAHASRGNALAVVKRYAEATAEFEKALSLDPNSYEAHYFYARACVFQGKIEQTTALYERAAAIKPDDYVCPCMLVQWYRSLGRKEDSKNAAHKGFKLAERQLTLHPDDARAAELGAQALIEIGQPDRAREWIARALAIEPNNPVTYYNAACSYALLGEIDKAFESLERGLPKSGPEWGRWIEHDSDLDPVRKDPRYQAILETIRRQESEKEI
ncbi:MAG TPA: adenylate/guanylate cyclase domain-containing protein [Chthoniobacterales bacterium]|jgi:adenylate cyclase|nr:adenylate/guanylate cyclase domain-containing protein [Chthoniobacterales bacterium]